MSRSQRTSVSAAFFVIPAVSLLLACFALWQGIFTDPAHAAPPPTTMNFQGRLADSSGNLMPDGLYNMQFRLFTVSSGGSAVWTETRENNGSDYRVQVTNGLFSTQLGEANALSASLFNATNLYFEITMATPGTATCSTASCATWESPMTPRHKLATSAYAFNAASLNGYTEADFAAASGSANYIQNGTSPQTADFNITGTGTAATLQASTFDRATSGTLTIGGANATTVSLADDTTIASGKTLRVVGDTSTNIIGYSSPTEGQITYDTTNKQLLVYSNGKWQADRAGAILVAASDSSQADKNAADYIGDGNTAAAADGDQVEINSAISAASTRTQTVYMLPGTYTVDAAIDMMPGVTLAGAGEGTVVTLPDSLAASINIVSINSDSNAVVRDFTIDGNKANQSGFYNHHGISVASTSSDVTIENMAISNNYDGRGVYINSASGTLVTNSVIKNNGTDGIYSDGSKGVFSNNRLITNNESGVSIAGSNNTVSDNYTESNGTGTVASSDIYITGSRNTVTGNTSYNAVRSGIHLFTGTNNTATGNTIDGSQAKGIIVNSDSSVVSSNSVYNATEAGIYIPDTSDINVIGNTVDAADGDGIELYGTTANTTIASNSIKNSGLHGINISTAGADNTVRGNTIRNYGTVTASSSGVYLSSIYDPDGVSIVDNRITDTTGTGYAIDIPDVNMDNTYLEGNVYSGAGAASVNDSGTDTIYGGQSDGTSYRIQPATGVLVGKVGGGSISAFQVQDANGDALLNVNSTSNYVINNGISAPGNFAQNPGFEAGAYTESDPDRASGWKLYGGAYTANDSANARSGNHELVIPAYASGVDAESKYYEVTPGDSYFVSLYVKATGSPNQDAGLLVTFYDKDKSATVYDGSYNSVPTASYTKKSVNGQVPAGAAFMRIIPTVRSQASPTGTYYFDDVFARITSDRAPYFNADSTTAFQVQNAAGTNILNIGTTNSTVLQNIATNGGAESGGSGWSARSGTTGPTISTTYYNTGDQSVYFGTNASGEGANYPITLSSTTTYTATFMARVSAGSGNILDFGYASDGATETNCKSSQSVPNTTGWRLQNCTFTTGTVSGSPYFYIKVNNSTARTLYIDSFQIVAGSNAGPYSEGTINTSALFQRSVAIAPTNDSSSALSVQTADGIGVFSVDTNTKRVGIGLDKPAALLHVSAVTPDEDLLRLQASGVTVMDVAYTGATSFRNHTNSTAAFQIQNAAGSAQLSLGTTAPSNIISNGNFETDSVGSLPSSWTAKGSATVQASNTVAWMGGQSMSIAATAANTGVQYATTLTVGNYYAVSLMAKAASSAFSNLNVGYTNGGGDQVACTNQYVSTTWTRIDCAFQVTSTNGTQLFITQNDSTSRTFYIDGVSVTQVANAGVLAPVYAESILKTSSKFDSPLIVAPTESSNLAFVVQSNSAHYNVPVLSVSTADDAVGIMTTGFESGVDLTFGAYDDRVVAVATNWSGAGNSLTIRGGNAGNGNSNGGDLVLQGGDRNGTGTAGSVIVKSQTDSTTAFQIQNNAGNSLFNVDTTTARGLVSVALGNTASTNAVCSSLANTTSPTANTAYELRDCSSAPAADYAEMYSVEQGIEYGDIVAVGTELVNTYDQKDGNIDWTKVKGKVTKLVKTSTVGQTNVIGIVSDNYGDFTSAGYNIKQQDNPMPVALNGRVPVKVASSSLPIMPGDYITTSNEPGKAQKASKAGMVIGKALETWTSASGQQMVMVYVEQGYYPGPTQLANNLVQNGGDANLATLIANTANIVNVNVSGQTTLKDLTVDGDSTFSGKLTVQDIEVQNIVIKGHIKTAGETPTITVGEAAGEKDPLNGIEAPHVTVEGNDTAGTITVVAGANTGSGLVAEVQFNSAFDNKPRAVLSAKNIQSSKLQIFNITDENKLQISSTSNLTAGEIYIFDYIIIQ